jgi:hypothetical protein
MHPFRAVRLAVLMSATVASVAVVGTPPASATTVGTAVFTGAITNAGGLAFLCSPVVVKPCPPTALPVTATTTGGGPKGEPTVGVGFPDGHKTTTFGFGTATCAYVGQNVTKLGKTPTDAGMCVITATGTVTGYCGLLTGTGTGTAIGPIGLGITQAIDFALTLTGVGTTVVVSGAATKPPHTGNLRAVIEVLGDSDPPPPPLTLPDSCLFGTADSFTTVGTAVLKLT